MKLKELRESLGITQTKIASDLNIPKMTYNNYEQNRNEPNIATLIRFADYYNVSLDYLVGRNFQNELGYLTSQELEYVKTLLQLNEQNKYKILFKAISLLNEQ